MPAQTVASALPLGDILGAILSMPWQREVTYRCSSCDIDHQGIAGSTGITKNGNRRRKVRLNSAVTVMFHTLDDETFIIASASPNHVRGGYDTKVMMIAAAERHCERQQAKKAIAAPGESIDDLIGQQAEVPNFA